MSSPVVEIPKETSTTQITITNGIPQEEISSKSKSKITQNKPSPAWPAILFFIIGIIVLIYIISSFTTTNKKAVAFLLDLIISGVGTILAWISWRSGKRETSYIITGVGILILLIVVIWYLAAV